jgi:hypothetical protein
MFDAATFTLNTVGLEGTRIFESQACAGKTLPRVKRHPSVAAGGYMVGYPGKRGCFAFRVDGKAHVFFYPDKTPGEVTCLDTTTAPFRSFDHYPGWGFAAISELKALMAEQKEEG